MLANRGDFGHLHLLSTASIQRVQDRAALQLVAAHSEYDTLQGLFTLAGVAVRWGLS